MNTYRIPGILQTNQGTLIAVYDIRYNNSADLPGNIDVGMSRSLDSGRTWQPMKIIMDMGEPHNQSGIGDPSILFDPVTKKNLGGGPVEQGQSFHSRIPARPFS